MNMSVRRAAESMIHGGSVEEAALNQVEMAVRAYDP
jgi:coenzyme F420-reducing hydrogenase alpha subunit